MRVVQGIDDEALQVLTLVYNDVEADIRLKFLPQVEAWFIDVSIGDKQANGIKLSCGTLHMQSRNMPIDFIVVDNTPNDIDPFRVDDFSSGRCSLYVADDEDMAIIRGQEVDF